VSFRLRTRLLTPSREREKGQETKDSERGGQERKERKTPFRPRCLQRRRQLARSVAFLQKKTQLSARLLAETEPPIGLLWLASGSPGELASNGWSSLSLSLSFQLLPIFAIDFAHVNCQMENGTDVYNLSFPLILTSATRARSREIATGAVAFNHNYTAEQKLLLNHMISR
jgi:hypothetical protein